LPTENSPALNQVVGLLPLKADKLIPHGINVVQVEHSRYGDNDHDYVDNESILSPVEVPEPVKVDI